MREGREVFNCMEKVKTPRWASMFAKILLAFFLLSLIVMFFVPWQQTSKGRGEVIALDPNNRVQNINATVDGRLDKWFVRDGMEVKKGEAIVSIVDIDPDYIRRLSLERNAARKKLEAARDARATSLKNYKRQESLFSQGLSSKLEVEKARINYKKLQSDEAEAAAALAQKEVKLARQKTQTVKAPQDGIILRTLHGSGSVFVKKGEKLAVFVPKEVALAAEIYVSGNDLPLVFPGRKVRLQFEGWPAVQFSGWPSVAVGTFAGTVLSIDPSASKGGKFRVIVVPTKGQEWPDNVYLRQGTRVYGWVLLNTVSIGYELWRTFNGFPPSMEGRPDSLNTQTKTSGTKK